MLAAWLRKEEIKQAREQGYAEGRKLALEAAKQRREGETLEQTLARLEPEKPNRR